MQYRIKRFSDLLSVRGAREERSETYLTVSGASTAVRNEEMEAKINR